MVERVLAKLELKSSSSLSPLLREAADWAVGRHKAQKTTLSPGCTFVRNDHRKSGVLHATLIGPLTDADATDDSSKWRAYCGWPCGGPNKSWFERIPDGAKLCTGRPCKRAFE